MKKSLFLCFALFLLTETTARVPNTALPMDFSANYPLLLTLASGTLVQVQLNEQLESHKLRPGKIVSFVVLADVKVRNYTVIRTGGLASGRVQSIENEGSWNRPVEIVLILEQVQTVDGQMIALNGQPAYIPAEAANLPAVARIGERMVANVMNDVEVTVEGH